MRHTQQYGYNKLCGSQLSYGLVAIVIGLAHFEVIAITYVSSLCCVCCHESGDYAFHFRKKAAGTVTFV